MADIAERLRSVNNTTRPYANDEVLAWCHEAAEALDTARARIAELEAERERLREIAARLRSSAADWEDHGADPMTKTPQNSRGVAEGLRMAAVTVMNALLTKDPSDAD